jgi:hypothetical protein
LTFSVQGASLHLVHDHRVVFGIGGIKLCDLFGREGFEQDSPLDLFAHVAAQIPRHCLAPGESVYRRPRLDPVIRAEQTENSILEA